MENCSQLVEKVGWITINLIGAVVVYDVGHFIYTTFLGRLLGFGIDLRKCGPWAVVTGATDGIGVKFVKQLASAGLNVVLISRTPAKLKTVADEIKTMHSLIEVKTIAVDFTKGKSIYPKIRAELEQLEIGILINNVGMTIGLDPFHKTKDELKLNNILNCNCLSMVRMCHLVLPQMVERRKGVIVNIGSIGSVVPFLNDSIYGASKAFVDKLSMDISAEVREYGVHVQTIHPGYVYTNMATHSPPSLLTPSPDTFAKAALATLGLGEKRTAAFWFHKILLFWSDFGAYFLPRRLLEMALNRERLMVRKKMFGY